MERKQSPAEQQFQKDVEILQNNECFARFMQWVYLEREADIDAMADAPTEKLQHLAGAASKAQQILKMMDWDAIRKKWEERI